jgi:hypothetical protein
LKQAFAKLMLQMTGCCVYTRLVETVETQATAALHQTQPQLDVFLDVLVHVCHVHSVYIPERRKL